MRRALLLLFLGLPYAVAWGANVAPINVPASTSTVFDISVVDDNELWYFNGPSPLNYKTKIQLQAGGPSQGSFRWEVTTNKPAIALETGGSLATKTNDPVLNVESKEISIEPDDVTVNLQYNGQNVGDFPLTVSAPLQRLTTLVRTIHETGNQDAIPPGFTTKARYHVFDQFGDSLPRPLEFNEFFDLTTVQPIHPYENTTWAINLVNINGGFTEQLPGSEDPDPSYFQDVYSRAGTFQIGPNGVPYTLTPLPETPFFPNYSTVEVFRVNQKYFMGSGTPGTGGQPGPGRQASFSTLHWKLDHVDPEMKND